jgi:hypothetical protein
VLTPQGISTMGNLKVGDTIWSGTQWTKVIKKVATGTKQVNAYKTEAGTFYGTENHRVVCRGEKVEAKDAIEIDTCVTPCLKRYRALHPLDILAGMVLGYGAPGVADRFRYGNDIIVRGFLRGVYSSNGTVIDGRIILNAASFAVIEALQEMLSSLGIISQYTVNREVGYHLSIEYDQGKTIFYEAIGFVYQTTDTARCGLPKTTFPIVEVVPLKEEPVFDITVDSEDHTYWTGGMRVSNCAEACLEAGSGEPCNLQEVNLTAISSKEEFAEAARLFHRWGKRVSMEKYHWPQIQEVITRNRRIGTGITGCLQRPDLFNPEVLDFVYKQIQEENVSYSKELDIEPSIRTTVIKPSGSLSKAFDSPCEGIHPAYSQYFIQRVRIASNDPLVPKILAAGHHVEPQQRLDGSLDPDTSVVDFYVKTPEGVPCADSGFDTWKQLEAVKMGQKYWADQSISVTTYYKDGDVPAIQEWVTNNLSQVKTISFLKHTGHGFVQAPKEAITEAQYEKLSAKVRPIEFDNLEAAGTIEGTECESGSCPVR